MMSHVEYGDGLLCDIPSIRRPVPGFNFPWAAAARPSGGAGMKSRQFRTSGHRGTRDFVAVGREQAHEPRWRNAFISVCVVGAALYALVAPLAS
jgi:hypothetical protein